MKKTLLIISFLALCSGTALAQNSDSRFVEKEQLLESVGILSSSNLYLSYLSISLINNILQDTTQIENLRGILNPMKNTLLMIADHVEKLQKIKNLSPEDVRIIQKIGKACRMLLEDAELLDEFMNNINEKNKLKFLAKHKETGEYLKELFKKEL